MEQIPGSGADSMPYGHLEDLLKQTLDIAKENRKILKRMERNALIGFIAKAIIWLIVLGVPILFLSAYIAPLMSAVSGGAGKAPAGIFGLPSAQQLQEIVNTYRGQK
jgi:hypothetical protein